MPTSEIDHITETVAGIQQAYDGALQRESPDEFGFVEQQINRLEATVREMQQEMWSAEARQAIEHIEDAQPLTPDDVAVIRAFLISDAEGYVANENNFRDWTCELARLLDEISRRTATVDRESIADLRGVLKDAIRLVPDIRNYLEEKHRIRQFNTALQSLDKPSRDMIGRILREQLESPKR